MSNSADDQISKAFTRTHRMGYELGFSDGKLAIVDLLIKWLEFSNASPITKNELRIQLQLAILQAPKKES